MVSYRFFPRADAAQDRIWRETSSRWGEAQAERYIRALHQHLDKLSRTKSPWRRLTLPSPETADRPSGIHFSRYGHHFVFFPELENGDIGIISILHERMDIPARLITDLAALDRDIS